MKKREWQTSIAAKVLWQEGAWRCPGITIDQYAREVVSKEEIGVWERWRSSRGPDPKGLKFGFYFKFGGKPLKNLRR